MNQDDDSVQSLDNSVQSLDGSAQSQGVQRGS